MPRPDQDEWQCRACGGVFWTPVDAMDDLTPYCPYCGNKEGD